MRRFSVKAWLVRLIDERIALTLIRWREKGNLLNDEQKAKLERAGAYEEGVK